MIGVFDSGFGGLYILRGIVKELPHYSYIYLGDSARAPYGPRSNEEVYTFTKQGVEFLFEHGAKLVVLACNTASSEALRKIQHEYHRGNTRKVLGVLIPFAEAAARQTVNKRVGVLATEGTVRSCAFVREIKKLDPEITVFQQACPLLVPLIEAGEQDSENADILIRTYLKPIFAKSIDTLVLGCTHYGFLERKICEMAGPHVRIISERDVIPGSLAAYLKRHVDVEKRITKDDPARFFSTGPIDRFESLGSIFFGEAIKAESVVLSGNSQAGI